MPLEARRLRKQRQGKRRSGSGRTAAPGKPMRMRIHNYTSNSLLDRRWHSSHLHEHVMTLLGHWRPQARCPSDHVLQQKITGSGFMGLWVKECSRCQQALSRGMTRYSCKRCGYHLCQSCCSMRTVEMLDEEITLSIYRPSQDLFPGLQLQEEDVLQVRLKAGSTVRALKEIVSHRSRKLCDLYGMPVAMQAIKRDIDAAAVQNEDQVACEDGDVLFLGNPFESLSFSANGEDHLSGLLSISEAVTGLLADAESRAQEQAMQEITLNVVMPRLEKANTAKALPEQRCQVVVVDTGSAEGMLETCVCKNGRSKRDGCCGTRRRAGRTRARICWANSAGRSHSPDDEPRRRRYPTSGSCMKQRWFGANFPCAAVRLRAPS
eukprot:s3659_g9.t1